MEKEKIQKMIKKAFAVRKKAYAPYSGFKVGACLLSKKGDIYLGCNIENAAYTPTNCAERTAFFKAVSEGETDFEAITIVGGYGDKTKDFCPPCGVCRQVMMEFCSPKDFKIITAKSEEEYKIYTLEELMPLGFGPDNI